MKRFWLMKSEPDVFSIDDLKKKGRAPWDGVRNYHARNFMRDGMKEGDLVLFYHSNATPPGVAGIARICREAYADPTAWDPKSEYFDPRSKPDKPLWMMVDVEFVEKFPRLVSLEELRGTPLLKDMLVIKRGMRLSVQPITQDNFKMIGKLGRS